MPRGRVANLCSVRHHEYRLCPGLLWRLQLRDDARWALLDHLRVPAAMKKRVVVIVAVGVCAALFLAFGLSRTRLQVQEPRANRDGLPGNSAPPATRAERSPRIPQHKTPAGLSADHATTPIGPRPGIERDTATLPATIEAAIATNPALAKDLACRDPQAKYSM